MKDERLYQLHILECIARIEQYVASGKDEFFAQMIIQDAVLRNLQTMAESTKRLPEELKSAHPQVSWRSIAAFRNVVVHDYLGIDLKQIWKIIEEDLPGLKPAIAAMLATADDTAS